jgi:hypothetical protein
MRRRHPSHWRLIATIGQGPCNRPLKLSCVYSRIRVLPPDVIVWSVKMMTLRTSAAIHTCQELYVVRDDDAALECWTCSCIHTSMRSVVGACSSLSWLGLPLSAYSKGLVHVLYLCRAACTGIKRSDQRPKL